MWGDGMRVKLSSIDIREVLHFLGWRGSPVEPELLDQLRTLCIQALENIEPRVAIRRFALDENAAPIGMGVQPIGRDVEAMLAPCDEAILLAATLGASSERLILREQAKNGAQAVLMDAVLSAAIESVCDQVQAQLEQEMAAQGKFLTDRFSPGYGDMPVAQSRDICEALDASRAIGLTVSRSGIMIPRKSVTAVIGISAAPVVRRPSGCAGCAAQRTCAFSKVNPMGADAAATADGVK